MFNRKKEIDLSKVEIIVMEGCGVRWHAYDSALEELSKVKDWKEIKKMAASSGGSMPAFLAAIGNPPTKIQDITTGLDLNELIDPVFLNKIPYFGVVFAFFLYHGFVQGNKMRQFAEKQLRAQGLSPELTFEELGKIIQENSRPDLKYLYLAAATVTRGSQLIIFSHESTPHVRLADAMVAALAYPGSGIPAKVLIDHKIEYFFDGGVRDNFIVNHFSKKETGKILGLKIDNYSEIFGYPYEYPSTSEFFYSLIQDNHQDFIQDSHRYSLQLYDCGLTTLNMPLSKLQNFALNVSGKLCMASLIENQVKPEFEKPEPKKIIEEILSKRTNITLRHLQEHTLTLQQITDQLCEWQKNNEEDYFHYGAVLQALRSYAGNLWNDTEYKVLFNLLKNESAKFAEKKEAFASDINDMLMAFLNDDEIELASQFLKKIMEGENASKLIDIDHSIILKKISGNDDSLALQSLQLSLENLHEQKLKLFPGAYEANKVMKLNQLVTTSQFDKAENMLSGSEFDCLRADLLSKLYLVTQVQVEQMHNSSSDKLLKLLEIKTGKLTSVHNFSLSYTQSFINFFKKSQPVAKPSCSSLKYDCKIPSAI